MEAPFPLSSLGLLVPSLRVMSAVMWKVVCLRNMKHYGKVEKFVSLVTEAIPDILTDRQMRLLTLGLRAKMILQLLSSEDAEDLKCVKTHLQSLQLSRSKQVNPGNEAIEANFVRLVQRLLEDTKGREHFLKNVFPMAYGPDFDAALEAVICEFFTRLENLLPIPDFKQTASWISDAPSVLEEYMQCVSRADDLKTLLKNKICLRKMDNIDDSAASRSEHQLLSSFSLCHPIRVTSKMIPESNSENYSEYMNTKDLEVSDNQSEPEEGTFPQEVGDVRIKDPSDEDTQPLNSSTPDQTLGGESSENIVELHLASPTSGAPATSSDCPVISSPMSAPPRQRVAHKCTQCGKCYIYRYELVEHQRIHTGENPYKCSQCGKAFRRTSDLSAHRRTQCTKAGYICIKCGKGFQSMQEKLRHQCVHCGQKFDCPQCGKSFKKMSLLGKHQLTHMQDRTFKCKQCGESYPGMSALRFHQKTHAPEQSNQCTQCGKIFSSVASLTAHEMRHRQKKTQMCVHCGKAFKNKHALKLHMRTHTGERPFQCTYCGKRFTISGNLNIHVRIHTGEKPYLCSDCGKGFVSAGELQIHRRTHTGEKPHKCTVCSKAFTMASKLTVHMRVHTGERPYVCSECGKGFSQRNVLKKHALSHTGARPYTCHLCEKAYTCMDHLKRHIKTHSVVKE